MDNSDYSSKVAVFRELEGTILSCILHHPGFIDRVMPILEVGYFSGPASKRAFELFHSFYERFNRGPTFAEFKVELTEVITQLPEEDRAALFQTVEAFSTQTEHDPNYVLTKIEEFASQAELRQTLAKAGQAVEDGHWEDAIELIRKPLLLSRVGSDMPTEYVSTFDTRIEERTQFEAIKRVPTGFPTLDHVLNGGLGFGELGTILAPTNYGKSQGLLNLGANAIKAEKVVLEVTLELSKLKVFSRMDSLLTGIPVNSLPNEEDMLRSRLPGLAQYQDLFYCEAYPTGSLTIEKLCGMVKNFKRVRGQLDLLLLDYADLLSIGKHNDLRIALGNIYKTLRGLAAEEQIAIWTCSQANRTGYTAQNISEVNVAESIDKMFVADVVISLNQRPEEYPNRMRLYVAKARDAAKWLEIAVRCDFSRARMWEDTERQSTGEPLDSSMVDKLQETLRARGQTESQEVKE